MGETHRDLTPIETMDVAACRLDGMFRDIFNTEERHDILRAALRAFAEMEPTDGMRKAANSAVKGGIGADFEKAARNFILSAAGEDKPEGK